MPSWLKKAFSKGKGDAAEAATASGTAPSSSAAPASGAKSKPKSKPKEKKKTSSNASALPSGPPVSRTGQGRVSTHDLAMAATTLGVAPPLVPSPGPPPFMYPSEASTSSSFQRVDIEQQQIDADLAMAYGMAAAQAAAAQGQAVPQWPPPPSQPQVAAALVTPSLSPFGDAVSLPPPPAGTRPDLAMAAALADSQFTARQADELARTTEAVYQAAVSKALEASLQTVNYDALLRDIKLWVIDLAAATDDVLAALGTIVRKKDEVAAGLEAALAAGDDRRVRKLTWQAEQLPAAEDRLRRLADSMAPVGVAVLELQDLRDHVNAATPPLNKAERERDQIIARMIKALSKAGLRPPGRDGAGGSAAGPPTDLRDLVAALIADAQRLPKMPRHRRSSKSGGSTATDLTDDGIVVDSTSRTSLPSSSTDLISFALPVASDEPEIVPAPIEEPEIVPVPAAEEEEVQQQQVRDGSKAAACGSMPATPPAEPALPQPALSPNGSFDEKKAEEEKQSKEDEKETKKKALWKRLSSRKASPAPSATSSGTHGAGSPSSTASSSRHTSGGGGSNVTVPVPFQLSSSRWRAKGPAGAPVAADALRRVPALISLHYELRKGGGVVAEAVGWTDGPSHSAQPSPAVTAPAPARATTATFDSPEAMVSFVREHGGFPPAAPSRFDPGDRWSVMCAAAGVHDALAAAERDLSGWEASPGATAAAECHRVVDTVAKVSALLAVVGNAHDPLRMAVAKHKLPWRDDLATSVRWAAQTAALAAMTAALDGAEGAHRTKGPWQRQAVLRPLGHGVMAAFAVHQLAGGFSTEAAAACDTLVEQTVHYARLIDPKWFRGHKVVS